MKGYVAAIVIVIVAVGAFVAGNFTTPLLRQPAAPKPLEDITFALNWTFDGEHPAFFVALDKGWYRQNGLNVKIVRGFGGSDTVKRVATGEVPIGIGDAISTVLSREKGLPVTIVGVFFDRPPFAFHALTESGIKHPRDLIGKTSAAPPGDVQRAAWPVLAKAIGVDPAGIKWINVDPAAKIATLCEKKADSTPFFYDAVAVLWKACGGQDKVVTMPYWKYGVDIYGLVIVANDNLIKNKPEVVRGFLNATYMAIQWSIQNPEKAVDIMRDYQPQLDKEFTLGQWYIEISTMQTDRIKQNKLGWTDRSQMEKTVDAAALAYDVRKINVDEVFTNRFLPNYKLPDVDVSAKLPDFLKS